VTRFAATRDCPAIRELISFSLDGELSEIESWKLRRHLAECGSCCNAAAELAAISMVLRNTPLERPLVRIAPHLLHRRRASSLRLLIPAAALALLSILSAFQGSLETRGHKALRLTTPGGVRAYDSYLLGLHRPLL
jgi:predicted anti-sigma-YlaC factor YlaD